MGASQCGCIRPRAWGGGSLFSALAESKKEERSPPIQSIAPSPSATGGAMKEEESASLQYDRPCGWDRCVCSTMPISFALSLHWQEASSVPYPQGTDGINLIPVKIAKKREPGHCKGIASSTLPAIFLDGRGSMEEPDTLQHVRDKNQEKLITLLQYSHNKDHCPDTTSHTTELPKAAVCFMHLLCSFLLYTY